MTGLDKAGSKIPPGTEIWEFSVGQYRSAGSLMTAWFGHGHAYSSHPPSLLPLGTEHHRSICSTSTCPEGKGWEDSFQSVASKKKKPTKWDDASKVPNFFLPNGKSGMPVKSFPVEGQTFNTRPDWQRQLACSHSSYFTGDHSQRPTPHMMRVCSPESRKPMWRLVQSGEWMLLVISSSSTHAMWRNKCYQLNWII